MTDDPKSQIPDYVPVIEPGHIPAEPLPVDVPIVADLTAPAPLEVELTQIVRAPKTWRYRLLRFSRILAVSLASLLVLGVGGAYGYFRYLQSIAPPAICFGCRPEAQPSGAAPRPAPIGTSVNFLLLGSDSRDGLTKQELRDLGTDKVGGRRTDTIILLHLSADRTKTVLVSFPRDAWVKIPGYRNNRINTAYGRGATVEDGANLLRATLEEITDIRIDHYIEVDFRGFLDVVKALDGVDVCLSRPANDPMAGLHLPAGRHTVHGVDALAFVRARHFDPRVDFGRIERQQKFIASMINKATSTGVLFNPTKLFPVLNSAFKSVRHDNLLGVGDIKDLIDSLHGLDPAKVTFLTAPVERTGPVGTGPNQASAVFLDEDAGEQLWEAIRTDGPLPGAEPAPSPSASGQPALTVKPSAINLRVLNGTETKGVAARAAKDLGEVGFTRKITIGDADSSGYSSTVIRYGLGHEDDARTVAAAIPGALTQEDASLDTTVEVVVGADYTGAQQVVIASPSPKPRNLGIIPGTFDSRTAADDPCD